MTTPVNLASILYLPLVHDLNTQNTTPHRTPYSVPSASCASCLDPFNIPPSHFLYHGSPLGSHAIKSGLFLEQTLGPWCAIFLCSFVFLRYPHGLAGLSTFIPLNSSTSVTWRDICAFLLLPAFRFHCHRKRPCRSFKSFEEAKGVILCPSAHYPDHSTHSHLNPIELRTCRSTSFIQILDYQSIENIGDQQQVSYT